MQSLTFTYPANTTPTTRVHVGAVSSGDLEIVVEPDAGSGVTTVVLRTSVDGFDVVWRRVLDRHFDNASEEARYEINDFGATPGMVSLRLSQTRELLREGNQS